MQIQHIAVYVADLEQMKTFYEHYFNAHANKLYHNQKTGFRSYFLTFETGARLELMHLEGMTTQVYPVRRMGYSHLAFSTGSKESVDTLTDKLQKDGYQVISGPRLTGDGYYESCILDPESNMIEITD